MAKESLAIKYRPKDFSDMTEQTAITEILKNQLVTKTFQHGYLFTGPAGTGKTTTARIFAFLINGGKGNPIEVDAASNSGVDNVRNIIGDAKRKPLDAEYKIFIIDECHSLSNGAWQALLKTLEEPPKFTIFIFCTTDPQKIPKTILSRVQRYNFQKISNAGIAQRLSRILIMENEEACEGGCDGAYDWNAEALEYIAKVSNGGMRDAITLMDKCLSLSPELTLDNVLETIGAEDYTTFFNFLDKLSCHIPEQSLGIIESIYNSGKDLKQFMKDFAKFILEVEKYAVCGNFDYITLPVTEEIKQQLFDLTETDEDRNAIFNVMEFIVALNSQLKWESDSRTLIELSILIYCGKENTEC